MDQSQENQLTPGQGLPAPVCSEDVVEIDGETMVQCTRCGFEGWPDAGTILGIGPIWGCPECDAVEGDLVPIPQNTEASRDEGGERL